ncbi:hypothetical protein A6A27_40115 [Micromonospora sp. CB01531]|nr:hypothetical protein A6A27_40115 [Micromonospora sp. CB01531]
MPLGHEVDGETISKTIQAMNDVDADCDAAQRAVNDTASYLRTQWHGDASNQFTASIHDWQEGLNMVKQGLQELNAAMGTYYQQTAQIENDNSMAATWTK